MTNNDYQTGCRYFNGYKPCGKSDHCDELCPSRDVVDSQILVLHLGAIGAVVRTTALLKPLKRRFPKSKIVWLTSPHIKPLLEDHPLIDEVYASDWQGITELTNYNFEQVLSIDKSKFAGGILRQLNFESFKGFFTDEFGKIMPADKDAEYLWENGLSNEVKFHQNTKSEIEMIFEAMGLEYNQNEYFLPLSTFEKDLAKKRRRLWARGSNKKIVGINTGCSPQISYKKLSIENLTSLIEDLMEREDCLVVLLGGPEDTKRNEYLAHKTGAIASDTESGLRDGLVSVAAVDIVFSGDSLGMHMAISQKKWVIAWFGPTCAHEIELYGRGEKILSTMACSPCWKRKCEKTLKCNDLVDIQPIVHALGRALESDLPEQKQVDIHT